MPFVNVNFADVDSFEPLPEGEYDVEVDKVEVRENKAGDGIYLNWELVVLDGEYENRRLWMITSLKETALFRLKQCFQDLELIDDEDEEVEIEYDDDEEPTNKSGPRLLYPEVDGLEAIAVVKNEMYDGREKNRVEQLFAGGRRSKPKTKSSGSKKSKSSSDSDNESGSSQKTTKKSSNRSSRSGSSRRRMR